MKTGNSGLRRLVAGSGALALALAGAVALAPTASAAPGPDQPNAPTSGTLTINKYGGVPVDQGGDLTDPLTGVEFTVTQVGRIVDETCVAIDLTDAADWDGLDGLFASQPTAPGDPFCLTSVTQVDETDAGSVGFDLAVGIYYVQETDPGDNPIVSPVPNFYVSIPTSDSDEEGGWNYNVVADPKNQLSEAPTKVISETPSDLVVGSTVTWTLTIPIPTLAAGETFDNGSVTDVLDSRLEYVSSTVKIGDDELTEGTDEDYTLDEDGVTWTFDTTVLDEHQGEDITIELVTKVVSVGDGAIANAGGEDGNYWSEFNNSKVPGGTTPYTYWGKLAINKTDDSENALKGAEFKVFEKAAEAQCDSTAPASGSVATGTSDEDGVVQWADVTPTNELGLWIQNSEDGPLTNPTKQYCVYETVIPAGHTATPIENPVTISASATVLTLDVINPKKQGPELPLTGAGGTAVMMTGGLLLIGAGAVAMIAIRRRRNQVA